MAIVTVPFRILSLLLCLLIAGPMSTPAWACARPETRVGGSPVFSSASTSADLDQTLEPRRESRGCGYDFVSGVCKYLYCHANPVMMTDPSGHFSLGEINVVGAIRTTLFVMNAVGAISNAKQTARYSVSAFEAISDEDPWNATLSIAGAVMHGGLTAMNVLGLKSFMGSIGPPPAGGVALAGGGTIAVGRVWQFALSNPAGKKWIFEEFIPVVGTGLGLFANNMRHEAQWEHRDSEGRIKTRGDSESGGEGASTGRLDFNQQKQTHTEWKILSELTGLKQGDIITIRGQYPPCNPGGRGCFDVMKEFARRNQVKVIYKMEGGPTWVLD